MNYRWKRLLPGLEHDGEDDGRAASSEVVAIALAISCLLSPFGAKAQAGALDVNFAPRIAAPTDSVDAAVLQPDGKLIVTGRFRIVGATLLSPEMTHMVRLNPDGTLDSSFNADGTFDSSFNAKIWETPILQVDGKVVLNASGFSVIRLELNGSLDPSFNLKGYVLTNGTFYAIYSVVSDPDGKLIVGGNFPGVNGQPHRYLARVNADGTLDRSFNPEIGPDLGPANNVTAAALQPDGKILIGGSFTTVGETTRNRLARLNRDGTLDASFDPRGGPNQPPWIILPLPDGKVLIAESFAGEGFSSYDGIHRPGLARLNSDGTLDAAFDPGSGISGDRITTAAAQEDGKLIVAGRFTGFNDTRRISGIVRLNTNGSVDTTFNTGSGAEGSNWGGIIFSVAVQPDNKIVAVGGFSSFNGTPRRGIARLNPDGSLDNDFNPDLEIPSVVGTMAVQSDGKALVGLASGSVALVNGMPRKNIARLNVDGSLDQSFDAGNSLVTAPSFIVPQPDGKLLIGHELNGAQGFSGQKILRLNAAGNADTSFSAETNIFFRLSGLLRQPDGKVLVGGMFKGTGNEGTGKSGVVRLNEDGSSDTNFMRGVGAAGNISTMALQSEEKILIGGVFTNYNGAGRTNLVRLNADGTVDSSFIAPGITNRNQMARFLSVESDGKIVMLINDSGFYSDLYNRLVRLNPDGSPDNSFTSPLIYVSALTIGRDGRIYCTGLTNKPVSYFTRSLFRLNLDGSVDPQFNPVSFDGNSYSYGGNVYSMALEPDGLSLLFAGQFNRVNGVLRTGFARVFTVEQPRLSAEYFGGAYRVLLSGESARVYQIDTSTNLTDWVPFGTVALTNSPQQFVDPNGGSVERQFYRASVVP
ncbi:MAG: hypothetical protein DME26_11600 [Verrucomicrobia bacterium]|nr:MAG: hypothetical protein DME26_11600 [Verrucomicrobiota bacterium]